MTPGAPSPGPPTAVAPRPGWPHHDAVLAWGFVCIWGSGYLASKIALQYATPLAVLALRFAVGAALLVPLAWWWNRREPLRWPDTPVAWIHVVVAGVLMHPVNLGGSHYAQYLGMSAGLVALVLALQPLVTAAFAALIWSERLSRLQVGGIVIGLVGVGLVVWRKVDMHTLSPAALLAVGTSLAAITVGTLYQRRFCATVDLRAATVVQFAAALLVLAPLARWAEDGSIRFGWPLVAAVAFLVIFASIVAVNALHTLMRRGAATRVTSLLYMTPVIAVLLEWGLFGVAPGVLTTVGIVVTTAGVIAVVRPEVVGRAWQTRADAR